MPSIPLTREGLCTTILTDYCVLVGGGERTGNAGGVTRGSLAAVGGEVVEEGMEGGGGGVFLGWEGYPAHVRAIGRSLELRSEDVTLRD